MTYCCKKNCFLGEKSRRKKKKICKMAPRNTYSESTLLSFLLLLTDLLYYRHATSFALLWWRVCKIIREIFTYLDNIMFIFTSCRSLFFVVLWIPLYRMSLLSNQTTLWSFSSHWRSVVSAATTWVVFCWKKCELPVIRDGTTFSLFTLFF